jgi:two-component system, OmpR family, response regulator VicR
MAKKIYIVDDDRDMVESTKILLEGNGYEVKTAYTIEDGDKLIKAQNPDLLLLDVMFPDKQSAGFDFCRELRTADVTKDIPVIMYTAVNRKFPYHYKTDEEWLPADDFINKPVQPAELLEKIKALLK